MLLCAHSVLNPCLIHLQCYSIILRLLVLTRVFSSALLFFFFCVDKSRCSRRALYPDSQSRRSSDHHLANCWYSMCNYGGLGPPQHLLVHRTYSTIVSDGLSDKDQLHILNAIGDYPAVTSGRIATLRARLKVVGTTSGDGSMPMGGRNIRHVHSK